MNVAAHSPHRTTAAIQARRRATESMLDRVRDALQQMRRGRVRVTVAAVARRANVSRTFLYQNTDARTLVATAAAEADGQRVHDQAQQTAQVEASWRERALNAEDALRRAHAEIAAQRTTIGHYWDRSAAWSTTFPRTASSGSSPRTPRSNSNSASSPRTTAN